ncbi:MAG: hypothetical protein CMO01_12685 [Thalassobius sp.]|nr:hypothetical protein [Thalassovita sp.]
MKKILYFLITCVFCPFLSYGQYSVENRLFQMNKFSINNAYAGFDGIPRLSITGSYQTNRTNDEATNYFHLINFDMPVATNLSIGTRFMHLQKGNVQNMVIEQSIGYKLDLNEQHKLNFGLGLGIQKNSLATDVYTNRYVQANDPLINQGNFNETQTRIEFGAVYQFKSLEVSISSPMLVGTDGIEQGLNAYADYDFYFSGDKYRLTLATMYSKTGVSGIQNEIYASTQFEYNKIIWIQAGYTDSEILHVGSGVNLKALNLGYNYSIPLGNELHSLINNNHQISLVFQFRKFARYKKFGRVER